MFEFLWGRKGYKYDNTRRWIRLPAAWPVKCQFQSQESVQRVTETLDVGAGGVAMTVSKKVPIGTQVQIEIHVPPLNRPIRVEGKVVRCSPAAQDVYELGIRFTRIDPADQQALDEGIKKFYSPREKSRQQTGIWWRRLP